MKTMNLWAHFAVETLRFSNDRHIHDEDHESLGTFCSWDTEMQKWSTYSWWRPWIFGHILQLRHWDSVMIDIFMMKAMNLFDWLHKIILVLFIYLTKKGYFGNGKLVIRKLWLLYLSHIYFKIETFLQLGIC
jgi:hypothetical protein